MLTDAQWAMLEPLIEACRAVLHGSAGRLVGAERRGGVGERPSSDHGCPSWPSS